MKRSFSMLVRNVELAIHIAGLVFTIPLLLFFRDAGLKVPAVPLLGAVSALGLFFGWKDLQKGSLISRSVMRTFTFSALGLLILLFSFAYAI